MVTRSMGSWLKGHRKPVIIHASIVAVFVLFTVLVAEPLFDRLERVPGEAQLIRVDLPAETGGIRFHFDEFVTDGVTAVEIRGWAFIWGQGSADSDTYVALKSSDRTYVFSTETLIKESVTEHFKELALNLDCSAFRTLLPARKVADGEYTIGVYIRKGDIEALQYTDRSVTKLEGAIEIG